MLKNGYFISVGAGKNQLPLILKLKDLGLKVIAIDQSPDAPGFKFSEIQIIQSITEYRKIYASLSKLILDEPIVGIGVRSYGKAAYTASYLAKKLDLPGTAPEAFRKFYNKKTMKAFLGENGILVPNSYSWQNNQNFSKFVQTLSYPCILKPIDTIAKQGIEVFPNSDSLLKRLNQLKARNDQFLLEEFIEGAEITVLGFVQNKKFILISISDKITTPFSPFIELSHRLPTIQVKSIGEVKLICHNIAQLTSMDHSPLVAEFKINRRGEIYLMEVMPEIGGEFLADFLIPEFYSYDYFQNYIYLLTGNPVMPVNLNLKRKKEIISQICFIAPPEGSSRFISGKKLTGLDAEIIFNKQLKSFGENVDTKDGNSCRVQVFGVTSSSMKNPEDLDSVLRKMYDAKFE